MKMQASKTQPAFYMDSSDMHKLDIPVKYPAANIWLNLDIA